MDPVSRVFLELRGEQEVSFLRFPECGACEERAALNILADVNGLNGVEVQEDSDELDIERHLENIEVGFKRRLCLR